VLEVARRASRILDFYRWGIKLAEKRRIDILLAKSQASAHSRQEWWGARNGSGHFEFSNEWAAMGRKPVAYLVDRFASSWNDDQRCHLLQIMSVSRDARILEPAFRSLRADNPTLRYYGIRVCGLIADPSQ